MLTSSSYESISSAGWKTNESLFFFSSIGSKGGTYRFLLVTYKASGFDDMEFLGGKEFLVVVTRGEEVKTAFSEFSI